MKQVFEKLKLFVEQNPDKFFMNVSEFEGVRTAVFDYSLTVPNNFSTQYALEARGSLFQIDEDDNYVATLAMPFEKFFNLHEYDYANTELMHEAVSTRYGIEVHSSEDVKKLPIKNIFTKEDGSIITNFMLDNKMHCKSNSSLTSEYARKAEELLCQNNNLYAVAYTLLKDGWNTIFEFTSNNPKYRVVLPYDTEKLTVLAVRNNATGEYMNYESIVSAYGEEHVVKRHDKTLSELLEEQHNAIGIEGYIVETECGLRYKIKTEWYVGVHRTKSHLFSSPRNVWEAFINEELDDCYETFAENQEAKDMLDKYVAKCDQLYTFIVHTGNKYYELHKDKGRAEFFAKLKETRQAGLTFAEEIALATYAARLYTADREDAMDRLKDILLIQKTVSRLGITSWEV